MPNPDEKVVDLTRLNRFLQHVQNLFAQKNGYYAGLTSGLSKNLDSRMSFVDPIAYLYRTMAGGEEVASSCKVHGIVGGSIGFNQLFDYTQKPTYTHNGITYTNNNDGSYTLSGLASENSYYLIKGIDADNHKYLIQGCARGGSDSTYMIRVSGAGGTDVGYEYGQGIILSNTSNLAVYMRVRYGTDLSGSNSKKFIPQIIDLTTMLGSTIANYIYSLEQATAGSGVAWFRRYWKKTYYPYTPISGFIHVKTSDKTPKTIAPTVMQVLSFL